MKTNRSVIALLCVAFVTTFTTAWSQETTAPAAELKALVSQVQEKLRANRRTASDLAPELAAFDALRAKYSAQRTDEAAQIALMQASLYRDVLKDNAKAKQVLMALQESHRGLPASAQAAAAITRMDRPPGPPPEQTEVVGKPAPEINFTWSTRKGLKKLSDLRGKVVVLDFWATWCGPCIATFPQIRELTAHYKNADVAVIGVTSLQGYVANLEPGRIDTRGNPDKETGLMPAFIKAKDMTWDVVFSEERVFNPSYGVQGIPHMTIIAPDGTVRHNGIHPSMAHAKKTELIDAILKEFRLPSSGRASGE